MWGGECDRARSGGDVMMASRSGLDLSGWCICIRGFGFAVVTKEPSVVWKGLLTFGLSSERYIFVRSLGFLSGFVLSPLTAFAAAAAAANESSAPQQYPWLLSTNTGQHYFCS